VRADRFFVSHGLHVKRLCMRKYACFLFTCVKVFVKCGHPCAFIYMILSRMCKGFHRFKDRIHSYGHTEIFAEGAPSP
jgi:hypothetical protein